MRQAVELEVADAIDRFLAAAAPPRQHLRARQQLRKRIGLGQIIVAARPQSLDPIIDLAERRENERGRLDAFAAQGANDREPVEFGEPAVDDEHVILAVKRLSESFLAICCRGGGGGGGGGHRSDICRPRARRAQRRAHSRRLPRYRSRRRWCVCSIRARSSA
jgi:hypothetical protein